MKTATLTIEVPDDFEKGECFFCRIALDGCCPIVIDARNCPLEIQENNNKLQYELEKALAKVPETYYRGLFNRKSELPIDGVLNNDYAFTFRIYKNKLFRKPVYHRYVFCRGEWIHQYVLSTEVTNEKDN